jgi:hypothetical protein
LDLEAKGLKGLHVQVSDLGDHQLLIAHDNRGFLHRLWRRNDTGLRDLLISLQAVLGAPPFREVQWYTREEYERPGSPDRGDLNPGAESPVA